MTTEMKPSPRERLLEAAATLTYRDGVGIGVEALCKAAGVSKRSMYQLFESKDELLAASLKERAAAFVASLLPPADDGRSPRERILHVFAQVESQAGTPEFRGCRYLAVQIELKDQTHPASRVAHQIKANLTAFFRAEAEQGGASDPDLLARQLILVFDGASARAGIQADKLTGLVAPTVTTLLGAAGFADASLIQNTPSPPDTRGKPNTRGKPDGRMCVAEHAAGEEACGLVGISAQRPVHGSPDAHPVGLDDLLDHVIALHLGGRHGDVPLHLHRSVSGRVEISRA